MSLELFSVLLLGVSVIISLTVEAIKKMLGNKKYSSNIIACLISLVLSPIIGICTCVILGIVIDSKVIICLIALTFLSWLCAMLGYDKVIQSIKQIKGGI